MEFVNAELKHSNHKVGINYWHMEFKTKYAYKMFAKFKYKSLIEACIRKVCHKHNIEINIMNVMPEHVHMMVTLPKGMVDDKAFQLFKGASSYHLLKNHPKTRLGYPQGHLWSRCGCAVSVGYNPLSDTIMYILKQAEHHAIACFC